MRSLILTTFVFVLFCISPDGSQAEVFDRELRDEQIKCLMKALEEIDKPNTKWQNAVFEEHGFPAVEMVGADGVKAFFLLVKHSGDTALKEKCRPRIENAFQEKVLSPSE